MHKKISTIVFLLVLGNINYELFNAAIFYCTNIQRIKYGRKPLKHSVYLQKSAEDHSKDMVIYNFYSHKSPVKGKRTMKDRFSAVGIDSDYKAENIFNSFEKNPTYWSFASELVQGWMDSNGHKKNILNSKYNYLGCGVYYYENPEWKDYFWVKATQNFSSEN